MRCNCCDRVLSEDEIHFNPEIKTWEMCSTCLDISLDAAYSGAFSFDDDDGDDLLSVPFDSGIEDFFVANELGFTSLERIDDEW